jgi:hypothetical protein
MGYYKLLMARTRELIERLNLEASYHRAVLGTIARALDGRVVDYDEYLGRLTQLGPEIAARAQRESIRSLLLAQAAALPAKEDLRPLQGRDGRADRRAVFAMLLEVNLTLALSASGEGRGEVPSPFTERVRVRFREEVIR